jgi:hypothetical protein
MIGWLARFLLFKAIPRKLVPLLTLIEIARLAREFRRRRYAINEPYRSRTAPPPPPGPDVPRRS